MCCVRSGANRAARRGAPLRHHPFATRATVGRRRAAGPARAWGFVFPTLAHASPPYLPLDRAPTQSRPGRGHPLARAGPNPPVRLRTGSAAERGAARLAQPRGPCWCARAAPLRLRGLAQAGPGWSHTPEGTPDPRAHGLWPAEPAEPAATPRGNPAAKASPLGERNTCRGAVRCRQVPPQSAMPHAERC